MRKGLSRGERVRIKTPWGMWRCSDGLEVLFNLQRWPILQRYPGGQTTGCDPTRRLNLNAKPFSLPDCSMHRGARMDWQPVSGSRSCWRTGTYRPSLTSNGTRRPLTVGGRFARPRGRQPLPDGGGSTFGAAPFDAERGRERQSRADVRLDLHGGASVLPEYYSR
jgi:hypothetical protein